MNYGPLTKQVEAFITKYMRKHDNPKLLFHNLFHTQSIVSATNQIASHYSLDEKELFVVVAASWFMYVGYYKDVLHPEEASANLAEAFLRNSAVEDETIASIKKCLTSLATANTDALLVNIFYDASYFYLGSENFSDYNKLKRKEAGLLNNISIDKNAWKRGTIQMLESHQYYTDYCKSLLNGNKQKNLEKLQKKNPPPSLIPNSIVSILDTKTAKVENKDQGKEKNKESKISSPEKTIETMFRTTSTNSQRLSSQADTKAHIMISVNTIIISLMLGLRQLAETTKFTVPVIILVVVNLVTIIFSILATRLNVKKRKFLQSDFEQNKVNLLFFGNFFSLDFEDYSNAMLHIMEDKKSLYINMLRNLYEQGAVLAKKYKLLKISYNVFMYGLILSVISFFVASNFF